MKLTSKQRAILRAEAHHLHAIVHMGHNGLTDSLVQATDDALRTHELVKVALARMADVKPKAAAHDLAEKLDAEVIQTIGRTCTLFRENPDLKKQQGAPPWR